MHDFTRNSKIEIECFTDLYEGILPVFQVDLTKNLEMFEKLQLEQLSPSSQTCWLHLCAILLPNHQANSEQTRLILKYFDWAKSCKSIACLRYIHTLMEQMMAEFHDGEPSTCLWRFIEQQTQESFEKFVLGVIKLCMGNFCVED